MPVTAIVNKNRRLKTNVMQDKASFKLISRNMGAGLEKSMVRPLRIKTGMTLE